MSRIVPVRWQLFEKFLLFVGCRFVREKGDHRIYKREDVKRPLVIPRDSILPVFIIKSNLKTLGISTKEYLEILDRI